MKFDIDWSQNSTKRGAIWIIGAIVMLVFMVFGKPDYVPWIVAGTQAVAGGVGVAISD